MLDEFLSFRNIFADIYADLHNWRSANIEPRHIMKLVYQLAEGNVFN